MIGVAILGYTHIRKDFGEKTGILFSFLTIFMPISLLYSQEIRMYSWAMFFVTLTTIYAYRMITNNKKKDWILFTLFSIISAYMHYFALFTVGFLNLFILIHILRKRKELVKKYIIVAIAQIVLYIPGLVVFLKQSLQVAMGFWIVVKYPDVLIETIRYHFQGNLTNTVSLIFALAVYAYIIFRFIKNKKEKVSILSISLFLAVVIFTLLVSRFRAVFIPRYTMPMMGLLMFFIATVMSKETKKYITAIICSLVVVVAIYNNYLSIKENYASNNRDMEKFISENLEEDDIFVYDNIGVGSLTAFDFKDNQQYFYNGGHWGIHTAYKAFLPSMEVIDYLESLDDYKGRVWVIDGEQAGMVNVLKDRYNTVTIIEPTSIHMDYNNTTCTVSLIEIGE